MAIAVKELKPSEDVGGPEEAQTERRRCRALTRRGERCRNQAKAGMTMCGSHALRALEVAAVSVAQVAPVAEAGPANIASQTRPRRSMSLSATLAWAAAGLVAAAGVIHLAFAPDHIKEYLPFGISFYVMGVGQLVGALAVGLWSRSRRLLFAAVVANVGLCGLWLVTRTVGLPIGATPWTAEKVGVADVTCVAFQLTLAVLLGALIIRRPVFSGLRERRFGLAWAAATLTAFFLVIVPLTIHASHTGHESGHDMAPASAMPASG